MKGSRPKTMPKTKSASVKGKMTMAKWEKSAMDRKADKAGKHGKEGSKRDIAADKAGIAAYNKKRKK